MIIHEIKGNIWDYLEVDHSLICIPTNGCLKKNKYGQPTIPVMGRGLAKEFANRYPEMLSDVVSFIKAGPTIPIFIDKFLLIPTKPDKLKIKSPEDLNKVMKKYRDENIKTYQGWMCKSDIELIKENLDIIDRNISLDFDLIMPKLGCGNGELKWSNVRPIINNIGHSVLIIDKV